jgi:hypothetical protein
MHHLGPVSFRFASFLTFSVQSARETARSLGVDLPAELFESERVEEVGMLNRAAIPRSTHLVDYHGFDRL